MKCKVGTDDFDKCYIFKINCRSINSEPSFVFKSSKMAAQLAIKMRIGLQQDKEPSTMVDEYAYMDAMHTRVKGYKALTFMDLSSWYASCYALGYNGSQKRKYRMFHCVFNIME